MQEPWKDREQRKQKKKDCELMLYHAAAYSNITKQSIVCPECGQLGRCDAERERVGSEYEFIVQFRACSHTFIGSVSVNFPGVMDGVKLTMLHQSL